MRAVWGEDHSLERQNKVALRILIVLRILPNFRRKIRLFAGPSDLKFQVAGQTN